MQEISMKTTAQIYDFSELQKKKRQRELREKRPFFITGAVLIISLLSVCFFLYFGDRVVKAQESANDIQYKVVEIKDGDSLWSIAKENMDNTNDSGFINIYQYILSSQPPQTVPAYSKADRLEYGPKVFLQIKDCHQPVFLSMPVKSYAVRCKAVFRPEAVYRPGSPFLVLKE